MALIYGEIDTYVPDISFEFFKEFVEETRGKHTELGHSKEEEIYFQRNNRKYPWERRILEHSKTCFHDYRNKPYFNKLQETIDSLPINKFDGRRVVFLLYQENQPDYDFNFHFDNDKPIGFRICFGLEINKPYLEQAKIKQEFQRHALELKKIENYMVEEKRYTLNPTRSNTIFCLNADKYPHRVPVNNYSSRAIVVVKGTLEDFSHLKFIQREDE